jgi:LysM repeat protein
MKASILDQEITLTPRGVDEPGRPHLVLVPTGAEAVRAAQEARTSPPQLRLTAFGRLVVSLLAAITLALLLSTFAGSLASASGEAKEITVRAGQTLSGIAAEHLPALSIPDAVVELQLLNGLSSSNIHVGQTLRIPAP